MTSTPDQNSSAPAKSTPGAAPPVNISSQAYLDPACYVKGQHLLTIEQGSVIHPRCRLYTDRGKVNVGPHCLLLERCIIGFDKEFNMPTNTDTSPTEAADITIGSETYLHSAVKLQPPCLIGECSILEAGVQILPGCNIGNHSKICAGITLPAGTTVPDWMVVYGLDGALRRHRQETIAEEVRLEGLSKERQTVEALLKLNATKNLSSAGGGSHRKRESVVRTESGKA